MCIQQRLICATREKVKAISWLRLLLFCVEFACSTSACMGSLQVAHLSSTVQKQAFLVLIGDSILATGVNASVSGCLSLVQGPCPL